MPQHIDIGDLGLTRAQDQEVREVLCKAEWAKREIARKQMQLAAKAGGERRLLRLPDGNGGEVKMMVHPMSYHYWGQRLGYECWSDAQFVAEYLRDNPECRVRSVSDNPTVLLQQKATTTAQEAGNGRRFHKVYGAVKGRLRACDTTA